MVYEDRFVIGIPFLILTAFNRGPRTRILMNSLQLRVSWQFAQPSPFLISHIKLEPNREFCCASRTITEIVTDGKADNTGIINGAILATLF